MVKTATETKTKAATKAATTKTKSGGGKKRAPSAYNLYMAEHMKAWRAEHPDRPVKEAMAAVAAQWREAPENPNRGQPPKGKKGAAKKAAPAKEEKQQQPSSEAEGSE